MRKQSVTFAAVLLVLSSSAAVSRAAPAGAKKAPAPLTDKQKKDIARLVGDFRKAETRGARFAPLKRIVAMGPEAAAIASKAVDEALAAQEKAYFDLLDKHIRAAYVQRLCMLRDDHVRRVQAMRRLWKD